MCVLTSNEIWELICLYAEGLILFICRGGQQCCCILSVQNQTSHIWYFVHNWKSPY